jgi:hypothetical protein
VGYAPNKTAYLLTENTANYFKLAKADNVVIDSPEKAAEYAKTYLEVTRSMSSLSYVVNSALDVEFRPNLDEDELFVKSSFLAKYATVITEPTVKSYADGYLVTAYMVHEQAVNEYTITVKENGEITTKIKTLEEDLPLVYGL